MSNITQINTLLQTTAEGIGLTYKRGRLDDINPTLNGESIAYPVLWCFPLRNSATFVNNEILTKTYTISIIFLDISETNIDRTAETDFTRIQTLEELADEFIYKFNQAQQFGILDSIAGEEFPLYAEYSHIVSGYTLVFNLTLNSGVCFE